MLSMEQAQKELHKAAIRKADYLPDSVVELFIEAEEDENDLYLPFEVGNIVTEMFDIHRIPYDFQEIPDTFSESLENIMADFNYHVEGVFGFPELSKFQNHPLYEKVMENVQIVYYPYSAGSGNLIEFIHLATSTFSTSDKKFEREFALQNPTAFLLAVQDNGGLDTHDILQFLSDLEQSISYLIELTK